MNWKTGAAALLLAAARASAEGLSPAGDGAFEYTVAADELNCVSLPFESVEVNTASGAEVTVNGGNIFVMPYSREVITVFATPAEDKRKSVMLRLIPRKTSARHIRVPPEMFARDEGAGGPEAAPAAEAPAAPRPRAAGSFPARAAGDSDPAGRLAREFAAVWVSFGENGPSALPGFERTVDPDDLRGAGPFCRADAETIEDAFLMNGKLFALVLLTSAAPADRVVCAGAAYGYSALNSAKIRPGAAKPVLVALPAAFVAGAGRR